VLPLQEHRVINEKDIFPKAFLLSNGFLGQSLSLMLGTFQHG